MSEHPLNGLLRQLALALSALTASEKLWVRELRRLRLSQQPQGRPLREVPAHFPSREAVGSARTSSTAKISEAAPFQSGAPAPPTHWPVVTEDIGAVPATVKRSYDYFAELDQKLEGLREQRLHSGGR
jgi:hypothetical protein